MPRVRQLLRRHGVLLAILVVALALRCAYLPVDTSVVDQSGVQAEVAHSILAEGRWFEENTQAIALRERLQKERGRILDPAEIDYAAVAAHPHWVPLLAELPGPGLMLAAVWELTGSERLIYGKVVQIALDLGVLLLVYWIVLVLFARRRAALIAAALYAVCFPIARQTALVDPDIWALYFTLAVIALFLQALRSNPRRRWLLVCGVTAGIGALFRANVVLLPLALGLAFLVWPSAPRPAWCSPRARPLRDALAITVVSVLVLAPWTLRNYLETHSFVPIRTGSGITLWEGLGEVHNDFGALNDDLATYEQVHRVHPDLVEFSVAYDAYLRDRALHSIARHPLFYVELVGRRVLLSTVGLYESAWMYNTGESPVRYRARTGKGLFSYAVHRPLELLESAYEPALFVLALLALLCTWKRYRREHLLLIAAALSAVLPYWLLHFEARYVLPTLPLYIAWIALGADLLVARVRRRVRARASVREVIA
jgi:4-amino-4-deoxy-L-arabinose transferase-like glycosyltransferase/post-segregation antitoxin (ccd killing protein)